MRTMFEYNLLIFLKSKSQIVISIDELLFEFRRLDTFYRI